MPTKLCLHPKCASPATSRGRCDQHRQELERERSARRRASPTQGYAIRIYHTKKWLLTRRAILHRDPICQLCDNELSAEVDHIKPLSQGGDPYNPANLRGLCARCHWIRHANEAA